MNSKKKIQIVLLIFGLFLIIFSIYYYYSQQTVKVTKKIEQITEEEINQDNIFENITYTGIDSRGNPYEIKAKFAETNTNDPDVNYLKYVIAKLVYKDGQIILITSDYAIYNKSSQDMFFNQNVVVENDINRVFCENLDFHNSDNLIVAYNNLTAYNGENVMFADKISIDLLTQTSKVSVTDKKKVKVKIVN